MLELRESMAKRVAWISIWSNIILTVGKIVIGIIASSDALFADGIHSAADVFAAVIVLLVLKVSNKPADLEHPYGHGKAEVIVSGVIGILLLLVSLYIVYEGVAGFFHPIETPSMIAFWIALFSYVAKECLFRYSMNVGKRVNSKAIEAVAYDHQADIVASLAAAIGILLSYLGDQLGITFLLYGDKVASIFVAYLIFKIAREMLTEAFHILIERNVQPEMMEQFEAVILSFDEVRRIDRIRAREHGHYIIMDIRISIDQDKTIKEGHDLSREIKNSLKEKFDHIEEVLIHLNPYFPE
ncbi:MULTISPECIES: cation diffusion facilitator family transporter [Bacillaceae]|uniref:cation diffusion facilitator family transporter n=1 Tax=Bacillaceae TaxID=186817 RepID=UPI001CEF7C56|nr:MULTISPECIES: cation diffusion facilitator family transporter [Bacillaceae]